jgi:uncharacterized glyoxalase superfamily protein PhnB
MKPTIYPFLRYTNAPAAMEWLGRAFLFEKQVAFAGPDGMIVHAEMRRGSGVIGLSSATPPTESNPWSAVRQGVYVTIDDVDGHHARALSAGARVAIQPSDTNYGSREYSAWDLEGHLWGFGTYPMGSPEGEPSLYPEIVYRRGADAVSWLEHAFGFTATEQIPGPDGAIVHAEMRLGDSTIMLNLGDTQGSSNGPAQAISVRVDDPDALFAHATAEGAIVVQAPVTTHYGARSCWVRDPDNFLWGFSTYRPAHSGGSWIMSRP